MRLPEVDPAVITANVAAALAEDLGDGDITAQLINADETATAFVITREEAVLCGRAWVDETLAQVDPGLVVEWHAEDGVPLQADQRIFTATGSARSLLTAERTALNFLQLLSATATSASRYASLVAHTSASLLDTRKTIPGLRLAQKYAVRCGGCENHRVGLYDAFLIKENHIAASGTIRGAITNARALFPDRRLEVEVESLQQLREAMDAAPDWIMLDNFSPDDLRRAVAENNTNIRLEASGGIESDADLISTAETGVDYVSIGALTKYVRAVDLSMRFET
ncbi:MAG: nicotinate-nucleotide diphosphorylase (carboxylating) [Gammaproteobacteria bacterium]|nr:nicotinate-nucleotide diphosphorylase (carboxylating) [Gammaproteobacteria bacterium]